MHRQNLLEQLQHYSLSSIITPQEKAQLADFQNFIISNQNCFSRANSGHITSSIWIINAQKTHTLLTHHKKFNEWIQLGGHNDGDANCQAVALQEAQEESGIDNFIFLHQGIFDIDIHAVPGPCAYHYDVRYLLQAALNSTYIVSEESNDLAWVPFNEIINYNSHESIMRMNEKFQKHFALKFRLANEHIDPLF